MIRAYRAADVRAAEEPLLAAGPPGALMAQAAFAVATHVLRELRARGERVPGARALALVGGGNNGGDALHASAFLARRGMSVTAALLTATPHADGLAAARAAGVEILPVRDPRADPEALLAAARRAGTWLDGIAGIGARGALREPLAGAVEALVTLRRDGGARPFVVAVDTPSGIGVDDGALPGAVLPADLTVTMGAVKPGLVLPPAAAAAGRVVLVDIGLGPGLAAADAPVLRLEPADVAALWPVPGDADHKYTRGVLGLLAGSAQYPGAGVLAAAGALAAGVGMVRHLGAPEVLAAIHGAHPEVVGAPGQVQAWALGPGTDPADRRTMDSLAVALAVARGEAMPVVLDAGALSLLWPDDGAPAPRLWPAAVLTPHAGELARLLAARGVTGDEGREPTRSDVEACPARWARVAAAHTGATVLLKGATTVVAPPEGPVLAQADGTPWLATAGSGDVLAGLLGALLAGSAAVVRADGSRAGTLAAAAAAVHGLAARRASRGGPVTASAVARALPRTLAELLTRA